MPSFPTIDLPKIDLPKIDLTDLDLTNLDLAALAQSARSTVRDAAYVMIGAGVLAAREVQIRGRALVGGVNSVVSRTSR